VEAIGHSFPGRIVVEEIYVTRTRRLAISLAMNAGLVVAQVLLGLVARSTGLLADAGHNLTDVGALALSMVAVRLALRPPSAERSFGNHRATILAALANASLIAVVTVLIVIGSIDRLGQPEHVRAGLVVLVASLGLVINGVAALILRDGTNDLNMRSAVLHMVGDALASLAVIVAAVALLLAPSATWLDPVSALVVAAIIVYQASRVFRSSIAVLLESTPSDVDLTELIAAMVDVPGVGEVHDLHVWSLSSEMRVLSAHLVLTGHPSLEEAQAVGERVKAAIAGPFSISHSTLELECERCNDDEDPCRMELVVQTTGSTRHR
jgi:cobalt-zinc-cadmium efflux system protein